METDFRNAKVGDRVWSIAYGWGVVKKTDYPYLEFKILVGFQKEISCSYTIDGIGGHGEFRTLFWDEVKIEPPPRPKRKVKKELKVMLYASEDDLRRGWIISSSCGFKSPIIATLTYETEE